MPSVMGRTAPCSAGNAEASASVPAADWTATVTE